MKIQYSDIGKLLGLIRELYETDSILLQIKINAYVSPEEYLFTYNCLPTLIICGLLKNVILSLACAHIQNGFSLASIELVTCHGESGRHHPSPEFP